ncbi:MAG TPA: hypothetical protein VKK79_14410 [Candidatus Lokiarchaeia archaeon]|nr:hypothetical protein [Candidatus Lokiarchaeia archaeon]
MILEEDIDLIKKKIALREWALGELKGFETKYGMSAGEFTSKWRVAAIHEPDDPDLLAEFLEWDGLAGTLEHVEGELKPFGDYLRKSTGSRGATA